MKRGIFVCSLAIVGLGAAVVDAQEPVVFEVGDLVHPVGALPNDLVIGGPLPTNDDDDPDLVSWSLISLIGPAGPQVGASVDPLTGVFAWQSNFSSPQGDYVATIQGVNNVGATTPAGTDAGTLTYRLVPEPASLTLCGLALLGLGFSHRRRRKTKCCSAPAAATIRVLPA
jgi:hypothetical protein